MRTTTLFLTSFIAVLSAFQSNAQCVATISGDNSICEGETTVLTVSVNTANPGCSCNNGEINQADVVWSYNNQSFEDEGFELSLTPSATTTVTVSISAPCIDGDPIEAEFTVTVNEPPVFNVVLSNSSEPTCVGNQLTFQLIGIFPNPVSTYVWTGASSANQPTATVNSAVAGALNVSCVVTDNQGCTATDDTTFNVTTINASITQSGSGTYCEGDQFTISANPNNSPNFASCQWQVLQTGFTPNPSNCGVTVSSATSSLHAGTWQVDIVDSNGCTTTESVNIQIQQAPNVNISLASNEVCVNADEVGISVSPQAGSYFMDSSCDAPNSNPIDVFDAEFDPSSSGVGSFCVCYTASSPNGCVAEACADITVFDLPQVSFSSIPDASCQSGPNVNLSEFVNPAPSQGTSGTFTVNNNCSVPTVLDPDHPCLSLGFNTVQYNYTDANGCTSSASSNIQIFEALQATAAAGFDYCAGATAQLGVGAQGGNPNTYTYAWSPGGGLNNPASSAPLVLEATETQEYTVTITDENGCSSSSSTTITVFPQPEILDILQDPTSFCAGASPTLSLQNNWTNNDWGISAQYDWISNSGSLFNGSNPFNTFDSVVDTTLVTIIVEFVPQPNSYDPGCATINANFTLNPVPDPLPNLVSNQTALCSGEVALFTASNLTDGSSFDWDFTPSPTTLEIIGNGNVALASWDGQSGTLDVTLVESLVNCAGQSSLSIELSAAEAPESAEIALIGNSTLVYTDSSPDCYRWGYIDEQGVIQYLFNVVTNEPETFQTVVLNQLNPSFLYFCEAWSGDCNNPDCSTIAVYDALFVNVDEAAMEEAISLYPNPNNGVFWLRTSRPLDGDVRMVVTNRLGQLQSEEVIASQAGTKLFNLNLEHLAPDLYMVSLFDRTGHVGSTRVIIHR